MSCKTALASMVLSLSIGYAVAGPTRGVINRDDFQVPASAAEGVPGEAELIEEFRGNQRARVIVKGDHQPITDLEVLVYEVSTTGGEEKLVARDKGTRDLVGIVWTPPRTGMYRIVIRNPAPQSRTNPYNKCYVTVR